MQIDAVPRGLAFVVEPILRKHPDLEVLDLSVWHLERENMVANALVESKPVVGSSRKRTVGSAASSKPMFTHFRWPPLMRRLSTPPTMLCWMWSSCRTLRTSSVIASMVSPVVPALFLRRAEKLICSLTVRSSCTISSWGTKPLMPFAARKSAAAPLIRIVPPTLPYVALPQRTFKKVVLPAPDGPMMAQMLPEEGISPVTPSSTRLPLPTVKLKSANAMFNVPDMAVMPRN